MSLQIDGAEILFKPLSGDFKSTEYRAIKGVCIRRYVCLRITPVFLEHVAAVSISVDHTASPPMGVDPI